MRPIACQSQTRRDEKLYQPLPGKLRHRQRANLSIAMSELRKQLTIPRMEHFARECVLRHVSTTGRCGSQICAQTSSLGPGMQLRGLPNAREAQLSASQCEAKGP